jgi:DNA mismatch repair protein MSH2
MKHHKDLVASSEGAAAALAALLAYTDLLADDANYGRYTLQPYSLDLYMRLDATALRALNVTESKTDANKNFSLFGLMNRTCTQGMGKRLLNRWLKQPLLDVHEIVGRLDVVQAFVESLELRTDLRSHLRRMPDIERLVSKLERRRAGLPDIVRLYQASVRLPIILNSLSRYEGNFTEILNKKYSNDLQEWTQPDHLGKFDGLVEAAVDLEQLQNGEYIISAGYDSSLQDIKKERDSVEQQIQRAHQQAADDLGLPTEKSLKLDKSSQWGHVFRITKKEEPKVRKKLTSQYITLETRKDGIKFTNAKLRRLSDLYTKLTEEYSTTQRELVSKVVDVAATFVEVFTGVATLLADMDVLLSFADLSVTSPTPYVRPSITSSVSLQSL